MRAKKRQQTTKKKTDFGKYSKQVLKFFSEKLLKKFVVLFFVMIFFSAITIVPIIKQILKNGTDIDIIGKVTLWGIMKDRFFVIAITAISGVVPYMYIPVLACLGYMYQVVIEISYVILDKGYFLGSILTLIPYVINIISISLVGAIGIYLCKINTNNFRAGQQRNMNWNSFILNIYQITGNKEKEKKVQKKIEEKQKKLESREVKIDYKQVLNICIICIVLQIVSSIIEYIII